MVAARVRPHFEAMAKERQREAGGDHTREKERLSSIDDKRSTPRKSGQRSRASDEAGVALNVSGASVDRARVVKERGIPEPDRRAKDVPQRQAASD